VNGQWENLKGDVSEEMGQKHGISQPVYYSHVEEGIENFLYVTKEPGGFY
jgi:hypothetical protein